MVDICELDITYRNERGLVYSNRTRCSRKMKYLLSKYVYIKKNNLMKSYVLCPFGH